MRKWVIAAMLLVVAGCTSGPPPSEVVGALGTEGLVPPIQIASSELADLAAVVADFCEDSGPENLSMARDAWMVAKRSWDQAGLATFFGPATMLSTVSKVDFTPISPDGIEELLASNTVIDYAFVDNQSASTRRGLGAIEYVLFGPEQRAGNARSCEFLTATTSVAADAATELSVAWTAGGSDGAVPFLETFTTTMDGNDALGDVVGAYVETLKRQTLFELGAALGISSAEPEPGAIPEGRAGAGALTYLAQIQSISGTLAAGADASLLELIRSRSGDVAEEIELLLAESEQALGEIEVPMVVFVADEPGPATALYDDLAELRTLFESDVVSLLDLTLGFSDSDGDSG